MKDNESKRNDLNEEIDENKVLEELQGLSSDDAIWCMILIELVVVWN